MKKVEEAQRDLSLLIHEPPAADCVAVIHVHSRGKQLELSHRWTTMETLLRRRQIHSEKKRKPLEVCRNVWKFACSLSL